MLLHTPQHEAPDLCHSSRASQHSPHPSHSSARLQPQHRAGREILNGNISLEGRWLWWSGQDSKGEENQSMIQNPVNEVTRYWQQLFFTRFKTICETSSGSGRCPQLSTLLDSWRMSMRHANSPCLLMSLSLPRLCRCKIRQWPIMWNNLCCWWIVVASLGQIAPPKPSQAESQGSHTIQAVWLSQTHSTAGDVPRAWAAGRESEWAHTASAERWLRAHAGSGGLRWRTVTPPSIWALHKGSPPHKPMTLFMLTFIKVIRGPLTGASHMGVKWTASGFSWKSVPDVLEYRSSEKIHVSGMVQSMKAQNISYTDE